MGVTIELGPESLPVLLSLGSFVLYTSQLFSVCNISSVEESELMLMISLAKMYSRCMCHYIFSCQ